MSGPYIMRKGVSELSDLKDGQAVFGYPGAEYLGKQYFVNNITGKTANGGESWDNAFAEVSEAITASETHRALQASTNAYIRNQIFVQGTGTAYTALTVLPLHCDIVGIGADPRGNGTGIARIGADTGATVGMASSVSIRGLNLYNLQIQAGTDSNAMTLTNLFRARFENVAFMGNNDCANPGTGLQAAIISGFVMKNCHFGTALHDFMVSIDMTGGGYFHNAIVEDCVLHGQTAGFRIAQGYTQTQGSWIRRNYIGGGRETCALGVDDNMNSGDIPHLIYAGNFVRATGDATLLNAGTARWIANFAANGFSTVTAS